MLTFSIFLAASYFFLPCTAMQERSKEKTYSVFYFPKGFSVNKADSVLLWYLGGIVSFEAEMLQNVLQGMYNVWWHWKEMVECAALTAVTDLKWPTRAHSHFRKTRYSTYVSSGHHCSIAKDKRERCHHNPVTCAVT